jgi:hypothetical protein
MLRYFLKLKKIILPIVIICLSFTVIIQQLKKSEILERITNQTNNIKINNQEEEKEIIKYPNLLKCKTQYDSSMLNESVRNDYSLEANERLQKLRIVRGILIYYPAEKHSRFEHEFKWFYLSWIEMQKYEPELWRTDLVIFMNQKYLSEAVTTFKELNCSTLNQRTSKEDLPMCTIIEYISVEDRVIQHFNESALKSFSSKEMFHHLFNKINIFDDSPENKWMFYGILKELNHYKYIDSILMAFDGYSYFKNHFDFLLRSDMDVFLTPLFGKWLPLNCNDFITGRGGYSADFNMNRLQRIAEHLHMKVGNERNLGSTWYSTAEQFRLVSYYTLISMVYISKEEFSNEERQGKVGTILWPGKDSLKFICFFSCGI